MNAASSPFRQNGVSRLAATGRSGFRQQIDGLGGCVQADASTLEIRATRQVLGGPDDRQAPIFRKESEGGIRRRMRRQPGGESGWRWSLGMGPSGRAAGTYGARFDGSHRGLGNGGCCEVGEPAGELFDAAARDDQHGYFGRSLREVGHGSSRAAPGAPPPLETPNSGGWDRPGFVVASPWIEGTSETRGSLNLDVSKPRFEVVCFRTSKRGHLRSSKPGFEPRELSVIKRPGGP